MDVKYISKQIRLLLYRNNNCELLTTEIRHLLDLHNYNHDFNVYDHKNVIMVEIPSVLQYTRYKKTTKIYERVL